MAEFAFEVLEKTFTCHRLDEDTVISPETMGSANVFAMTAAGDVTVLAPDDVVVDHAAESEHGFRCLRLMQAMGFTEVGIAATITGVLAARGISVLVQSGYHHDYFFLKEDQLDSARSALADAGHEVR